MPTRAFGDLRLKYKEFNNPEQVPAVKGFRPPIENFNGPYISHLPEIMSFDLTKNDKKVVLATDGLWDELKVKDV